MGIDMFAVRLHNVACRGQSLAGCEAREWFCAPWFASRPPARAARRSAFERCQSRRREGAACRETRPGEIIACALWAVSLCLHVIGLLSFTSSVSLLLTPFYSLSRSCA